MNIHSGHQLNAVYFYFNIKIFSPVDYI